MHRNPSETFPSEARCELLFWYANKQEEAELTTITLFVVRALDTHSNDHYRECFLADGHF